MTLIRELIGNTIAEWDDGAPLVWTMREPKGPKNRRETKTAYFDLSSLADGYETAFLIAFKNVLIERRKRVSLATVQTNHKKTRSLLAKMCAALRTKGKIAVIDLAFLTNLREVDIAPGNLDTLSNVFSSHHGSPMFAQGLVDSDFPKATKKKGEVGEAIDNILASALTRAACVHILGAVERAWEKDDIDIGLFAFAQLAFLTFVRPDSYVHINVSDLIPTRDDKSGETIYTLLLSYPKTRAHVAPHEIPFKLNRRMGELLSLQRIHVIETYGHLVDESNLDRLALFPNRHLNAGGQWESKEARQCYGRCSPTIFRKHYLNPIHKLANIRFDFVGLRHTVGTQLGAAGLSSTEIQAVLKHAKKTTCQAYVDIHFNDMIKGLSEAMEPAFIRHFPVIERFRSTSDPIDLSKAIRSCSEDGTHRELSGECGARIACKHAPIACYACHRFIPCYDVDHSINLDKVEADIQRFESAGKPFLTMLEMSKEARLYIKLVIAASERYRETLGAGAKR